ncbi:hypothetical protein [Pseudoruegeria sp. SHC-113]|uniref:hypothetical protein n=1 Tax=Pseudoruegeria sp. SHC-113 TaxID=2855439 RepID=UPI0021BAC318|nr:hypothetical protein [Pseudoruegeria sp. SHC-113]MCT8159583.1 hypothetical protein [Pseudoruegeria sp. SHC-113]
MTDRSEMDDELELFFSAGRAHAAQPSNDLLMKIAAEADAEALAREALVAAQARPAPRGLWAGLVATIGGWPAMAGVLTASAAGFWIGFSAPAPLADGVSWLNDTAYVSDYLPSYELASALE